MAEDDTAWSHGCHGQCSIRVTCAREGKLHQDIMTSDLGEVGLLYTEQERETLPRYNFRSKVY